MTSQKLSFPRQHARTQRFTLGAPRAFTVSPDGTRVLFLRSASGTDRANRLMVLDTGTGEERVAADPAALLGGSAEKLSPQERARRERTREGSAGIVGYAVDDAAELAAFTLSGRAYVAELRAGDGARPAGTGPGDRSAALPDGRHVAYVVRGALRVVGAEGERDRVVAEPEDANTSYGLAEFVAAEEMSRYRGFWWSPGSDRLLVARVDDSAVQRWWIADPAHPGSKPAEVGYPAAGTANAAVTLFVTDLDGNRTEVVWDRSRFPYLARVHWSTNGAPLLLVQARDQRSQLHLAVDPESGATRTVHVDEDDIWLDLFAGVPAWAPDGRLVRITDEGGARVLSVGDRLLTGDRLHIQAVLDIGESDILVQATAGESAADPETGQSHVYRVNELGVERVSEGAGVHSAVRSGRVTVLVSASLEHPGTAVQVLGDGRRIATVANLAQEPVLTARVHLTEGAHGASRAPCCSPPGTRNPTVRFRC